MKKLRIAQVGTIWETTPPKLYGGTERVVYELTEELVRKGHEVTLFATGNSKTSGTLSCTYARSAYRNGVPWENFLYPLEHIATVFERAHEFDIIHMHLNQNQDYVALVLAGLIKTPVVFTIHFPLPTAKNKNRHDEMKFFKKYRDKNFISISNSQRTLDLNYVATVYNGLDFSDYKIPRDPGKDLVWIGRFIKEKGVKEAVAAAEKSNNNLILAGKVDTLVPSSRDYFNHEIKPHIDGKRVRYIGEINDSKKRQLLKKAKAFLMPIQWDEPFGLTMIEAMAMGVPVIAFDRGSAREIVLDGKTGFIVKNTEQMVAAIKKVDTLDRAFISNYSKTHFSSEVMAAHYLEVYESLIAQSKKEEKRRSWSQGAYIVQRDADFEK